MDIVSERFEPIAIRTQNRKAAAAKFGNNGFSELV
jgi:hypothetical protein